MLAADCLPPSAEVYGTVTESGNVIVPAEVGFMVDDVSVDPC